MGDSRPSTALGAPGTPLKFLFSFLFAVFFIASVHAQISPGPLSKAHQSLSGTSQCVSCHKLGAGSAAFRCVDCHKDIAQRITEKRGFHATVVSKGEAETACAKCHSEHNGEDFNLIRWEPSREEFNHRRTGYPLEGKHARIDCAQCHNPARISESEKPSIIVKDLTRTFLGLSRDCLACHRDPHQGQLGRDCARCHGLEAWKGPGGFDHSRTRFPLTGRHIQVTCQKCHPPTGKPEAPLRFTVPAFGKCADCHRDPHRGAFAASCESCHATSGWKAVSLAGKFDHARTDFPLLGKHAQVQCSACHTRADFKLPVAHGACADCHRPDPHGGQFRERADRGDCAACHTVESFKVSRFSVTDHARTKYPLEGRHAEVACAKCHLPAGKATRYKIPFARCLDCHRDAHAGQFAGPPHQNRCEACHSLKGFRPSTYTLARHQSSRFPLTGGHQAVACVDCHRIPGPAKPGAAAPYHFENRSCAACHADPHDGEFAERMSRREKNGSAVGCQACHSTKSWRELTGFDHSTTAFVLTGAHRAVACIDCHKPPNLETNLKNVKFRSAPRDCALCHEDAHANQFAKDGRVPACTDCHNTTRWKPALFDHDRLTRFPLKGGHEAVRCSACHNRFEEVAGQKVLFYKPTPTQCAACHGSAG